MAWFISRKRDGPDSVLLGHLELRASDSSTLVEAANCSRIGKSIDGNILPAEMYLKRPRKRVADFFMAIDGIPVVSPKLKELIELHESSPKNFFPILIRESKRGKVIGEYYFFNILDPLDAVQESEGSGIKFGEDGFGRTHFSIHETLGDVEFVLRRDVIRNRSIWNDKLQFWSRGLFVSNSFLELMEFEGITGFRKVAFCREVEDVI